MENFKIGEGPVKLNSILDIVRKSGSFRNGIWMRQWRSFGQNLEMNPITLIQMERKILLHSIGPHEILHELLSSWIAEKGSMGTLKALYQAFDALDMKDITELLEEEFWLLAVKSLKIKLFENVVELENIPLQNSSRYAYQLIYDTMKLSTFTQPIQLLKDDVIPKAVTNYYIHRELSFMTQMTDQIFQSDAIKNHLIVVKGIEKPELVALSHYQTIDMSGNQLEEISVRFVVLERDEDYTKMCQKTRDPVHLIQHDNNRFFWVKSSRGLDTIQPFIKGSKNIYGEDKLMEKIVRSRAQAVTISDSPGMGKSFLLTNLAFKLKSRNNSFVMIVVLNEFVKQTQRINSPQSALTAIAEYVSSTEISKVLLKTILSNSALSVDLFLDGYDEVDPLQLSNVDEFLKSLKRLQNFRVFITTRLHFESRLENILNVPSYHILPFDESKQIAFLIKYWVNEHGAEPGEKLENFARECLKMLCSQMTDIEKGIAGIPLQCRMFADVFAEDAERVSKVDSESAKKVKIVSLYDMYKRLVKLKFRATLQYSQNHEGVVRANYFKAHLYYSLALLFPDWIEKFKPHLDGFQQIKENLLYSIGLIEKSPCMDSPRFVHRTYAEFMLAGFLVQNTHSVCVEMIFGAILGGDGFKDVKPWHRKRLNLHSNMKYPVMAYFINMYFKDAIKQNSAKQLAATISKHKNQIALEDVCKAIITCGREDLEASLEVSMEVLKNLMLDQKQDPLYIPYILDKYFLLLPHFAVHTYEKVTVIKKVVEFIKKAFTVNLNYHMLQIDYIYSYPWIPGCTPLHVAAYYGKYNIVTYLVEEYGDGIKKLQHIFHVCVYNSSKNSESMVQEKLTIINLLAYTAKRHGLNWIDETLEGRTPLMVENAHDLLLERLHKVKADLLSNRLSLQTTYQFDHNQLIQVMTTILDAKTLETFHKEGTDFNFQDASGDSVLFHALKFQTTAIINKIIDYGANVNHRNNKDQSAAHVLFSGISRNNSREVLNKLNLLITRGYNLLNKADTTGVKPFHIMTANIEETDSPELFSLFCFQRDGDDSIAEAESAKVSSIPASVMEDVNKLDRDNHTAAHLEIRDAIEFKISTDDLIARLRVLISKGFGKINHLDNTGLTPLHLAMTLKGMDLKLLHFFYEAGANFACKDSKDKPLLATAIANNHDHLIIKKLLEYGSDLYERSPTTNMNMLRWAARYGNCSALKFIIDKLDINSKTTSGRTPLYDLVVNDKLLNPDLLDLFHEKGAKFDIVTTDGWSILHGAIKNNRNATIIKTLIDYGADKYQLNFQKANALHVAAYYGNKSTLKFFLDEFDIESLDKYGRTPLLRLVSNKKPLDPELIDMFFQKGANFNAVTTDGWSVLLCAIKNNQNARVVKTLIEYGADLNFLNFNKANALHVAAYSRNCSALEFLFDKLDINSKDKSGKSPLQCLVLSTDPLDPKLIGLFHEKGANFHDVDNDGLSVILNAIMGLQNAGIIHELRKFGSDLLHLASDDLNALHVASCIRNLSAIEFLVDKFDINSVNSRGQTPLHCLVLNMEPLDPSLLDLFHENRANFNVVANNGWSILHSAILNKQDSTIIKKIIEYGADLYYQNFDQVTALHVAAYSRNSSVLEFLIDKFDINCVDACGRTPLQHLLSSEETLDTNLLELFQKHGANFNVADNCGWSTSFYAVENNQIATALSEPIECEFETFVTRL